MLLNGRYASFCYPGAGRGFNIWSRAGLFTIWRYRGRVILLLNREYDFFLPGGESIQLDILYFCERGSFTIGRYLGAVHFCREYIHLLLPGRGYFNLPFYIRLYFRRGICDYLLSGREGYFYLQEGEGQGSIY